MQDSSVDVDEQVLLGLVLDLNKGVLVAVPVDPQQGFNLGARKYQIKKSTQVLVYTVSMYLVHKICCSASLLIILPLTGISQYNLVQFFKETFKTKVISKTNLYLTYEIVIYRVFIKHFVFPYNFVIFLNSASSAAALVYLLMFVHTLTARENRERPESGIF